MRKDASRKNWLKSALIPFLSLLSKERFILNKNELHYIKSHWVAISAVVRPQNRRLCFALLVWSYFWVTPGRSWFSWFYLTCSHLLQLISGFSICYKRRFITCSVLQIYEKWTLCLCLFYKVRQVLLQNGKLFVLQNGASGITK